MTSRERILAAIHHKEPDVVPVDLGSNPSSGISAIAYNNLKKELGLDGGATRIYDVVQQLAEPEQVVLDRFGVDVIDIGRAFNTHSADWYEVTLADGSTALYPNWFHPVLRDNGEYEAVVNGEVIAKMPEGGTFFDETVFPYEEGYPDDFSDLPKQMGRVLWAALAHSPWDRAGQEGFWDDLRARALHLRESTDKALMVVCGCNLFEWGTFLRRIDNFLMDIAAEPEEVERLVEALMEVHLKTLEKVCAAVGDVCDILRFGDDLGMISGPFMRPDDYRRLFKPHHTRLNEYVHTYSQMKTFLHSCGSVYRLIPDFIEAGYDVLNPIQTNCADMDPVRLKKEFGADITFWGGGCDTASVLNKATPGEVRRHVLERLEIFAPGGGFVFNTIHNILPEVPSTNIIAAFDAVREFNRGGA